MAYEIRSKGLVKLKVARSSFEEKAAIKAEFFIHAGQHGAYHTGLVWSILKLKTQFAGE